jgi:hypothetical protein
MQLCEKHKQLYGNSFTYTLIDKRAIARQQNKQIVTTVAGVSLGFGAAVITYNILKQ